MAKEGLEILVVDGDPAYGRLLAENLPRHLAVPTVVTVVSCAADAVARLESSSFDVIVTDPDLPDSRGLATFNRIAGAAHGVPIVLLTAAENETTADEFLSLGAEECLAKHAVDVARLSTTVRHAVARHAYRRSLQPLESPESQERFRLLADNTNEAFGILEAESLKPVYLSRAWEEIWGRRALDAFAGPEVFLDAIHPEDLSRVVSDLLALRRAEPVFGTFRVRRPDGAERWVRGRGFAIPNSRRQPRRFVCLFEDITRMRQTEEHLRQAQKMEAIGRLAGGIAHDFNNLLVVIQGYAELMADELGPSHRMNAHVNEVLAASRSATALTKQLLAFSRRQILQPQLLDLNAVLRGMERLLRRVIGEDIALAMGLTEPLGLVNADPGQIEQVVMNLVINARHAMPQGGRITIETRGVEVDAEYLAGHPGAMAGGHVMIAVSDTGVGMDAATQQRLFEPFFTTKPPGQGTGLGLATVYGIVKQSHGSINVYSEPGSGSVFKIYLPVVDAAATSSKPQRGQVPAEGGTETVLVVEDQAEVRGLIQGALGNHGYRVLAAGIGAEAIALARQHDGPIHVLLTDIVLPGMSGREVALAVLAERPEVRVLFMSGYTDDAIVQHGVLEPGLAFLQKPFTINALLRKVREVLAVDEPPSA